MVNPLILPYKQKNYSVNRLFVEINKHIPKLKWKIKF